MIKTKLIDYIKWENRTNFFLGLWVLLIPWTITEGFSVDAGNAKLWNFVMIGLIIMISSRLAIKKLVAWAEWQSLYAGIWLMASPWFLLYSDYPLLFWNSLVVGALITVFSAMTIPTVEKHMKFRFMKHKADHDHHYLIKH